MSTRVCPDCGTQYVASVRRCIDCDAMLVDEVGPEGEVTDTVATPVGVGDQIAYELDGWGNQLRVTLAGMLDLHDIPYVWEMGALVVAASHEEAVDELVAAVEGGEGEELDADTPQVAFEIEGVSADELEALDAELIAAHIPHAWQETGELLVPEASEDDVAQIIDAILNPADDQAEDDGLATHAALDLLYVAVDKLGKDPSDAKLLARYLAAADGIAGLSVPYGMSGKEWETLLGQVSELRDVVAPADDTKDDDAGAEETAAEESTTEGSAGEPEIASDDDEESAEAPDDEAGDANPAVAAGGAAPVGELIARLRTRLLDLV